MISLFAWRNLWRNKLRSMVIISAVALGIFAGIFLIAFSNGLVNSRIQAIIKNEISHIQIHHPGFLDNNDFTLRIENADSILDLIRKNKHVQVAVKRIIINSMIASAESNTGVRITGVEPPVEKNLSNISTSIIGGTYLEENSHNPVVISQRLAQKLKVKIKNKIIITLQDVSKNITSGAFRVCGIYRTDNMMFDESNIFVNYSDLTRLTGLPANEAHEIAILLDKNENTESTTNTLASEFPNLDVKNWQQLSPEAGYLVSAMDQYLYIFIIIILIALCFGIVNTMLMVIMERVKELGMLMAIGMNRARVFYMIMLETIYLSLIGGLLGIVIGYLISKYFERTGINMYSFKEAFSEMGYSALVYPVVNSTNMIITSIMVVIAGIVSALYPAYKALRLNPSEAIRTQ